MNLILESRERPNQVDIVRNIVRSVARGNVNLQLGRYVTEKDKEAGRSMMREYVIKMPE